MSAASFLPPEAFGVDFDLVSPHRLAPSPSGDQNAADDIGVVKIMVEPDATGDGGPARGPGPQGFGVLPGVGIGQAVHGPDVPIGGAAANPGDMPQLPTRQGRDAAVDAAAVPGAAAGADEQPTPDETLTPGLAPTAAQSTTPGSRTGTPSADAKRTPTPDMRERDARRDRCRGDPNAAADRRAPPTGDRNSGAHADPPGRPAPSEEVVTATALRAG